MLRPHLSLVSASSYAQAIIHSLLTRLGADVEVAVPFFGLLMANATTKENYWLTPGTPVADFIRKYLRLPLDDWK